MKNQKHNTTTEATFTLFTFFEIIFRSEFELILSDFSPIFTLACFFIILLSRDFQHFHGKSREHGNRL